MNNWAKKYHKIEDFSTNKHKQVNSVNSLSELKGKHSPLHTLVSALLQVENPIKPETLSREYYTVKPCPDSLSAENLK